MNRRCFLSLLGLAPVVAPIAARAALEPACAVTIPPAAFEPLTTGLAITFIDHATPMLQRIADALDVPLAELTRDFSRHSDEIEARRAEVKRLGLWTPSPDEADPQGSAA